MKHTIERQRSILIPDTITNYQYDSLMERLNKLEYILDFELTDDHLYIKYDLKQISFNEIWSVIIEVMLQNQYPPFSWWKYKLLAQLEANEKDHLVNRFGWYEYVTDIFISHHSESRNDPNKKKLWSHYSNKEKSQISDDINHEG